MYTRVPLQRYCVDHVFMANLSRECDRLKGARFYTCLSTFLYRKFVLSSLPEIGAYPYGWYSMGILFFE